VGLAKRIAHRIRESSGGLPAVQAKGFFIEELGCAQVSMNLLDIEQTPVWAAWEAVRAEAAEDGVALAESELVGLAPLAAFQAVADRAGASRDLPPEDRVLIAGRYLKLRDASPLMALELRLDRAAGR
jgi:glutamate formiminotransferase